MEKLTADWIFSPEGLHRDHCLEVDAEGKVISLRPLRAGEAARHYSGLLCPGFVNAHCHLELSMFRGQIPEGKGMTGFAREIVQRRGEFSPEEARQALYDALREAYYTGTVAMGDICNGPDSLPEKQAFPQLFVHNFIELLGLDGSKAGQIFEQGQELKASFPPSHTSLTLHAPYSVSAELRKLVYQQSEGLLSLHLLESEAEREVFEKGTGDFIDFFGQLGLEVPPFEEERPQDHLLKGLPSHRPVLLVHCLQASPAEIAELAERHPRAWFCLCPRSNAFLHGQLPDIRAFLPYAHRICLGTDSLASTPSLQMLEELKTLQAQFPQLGLHSLLRWGSLQGADALQQGHRFGRFAPGTQPGINLIEGLEAGPRLGSGSSLTKLY
jgi:cytosine/adenosine deaminase-related metal-dependent hydrolase